MIFQHSFFKTLPQNIKKSFEEIMRLENQTICEITHLKRKNAQVNWFKLHLHCDVPYDQHGIILTKESYEKLLEKRLGIGDRIAKVENRPKLRP